MCEKTVQQPRFRIEFPEHRGPLQGWLTALLAAVAFAVAMTLGLVFFLLFLALALVVAAVIAVRVWWFKRKLGVGGPAGPGAPGASATGTTIEGDYQVLEGAPSSNSGRENQR